MPEPNALSSKSIRLTLEKFGAEVSDSTADHIAQYIDLLLRWNQRINLTSVTDPLLILERHFGESLFGAISMGIELGELLDIGSGAGFPAVPIAMIRPNLSLTLLESNGKKAAFLGEVCRSLGLSSRARISRKRLEEFSATAPYDFVTSRAVRITEGFLGHCAGLLKSGGKLVLWVGEKEAKAATENTGWIWGQPVRVPGSERRYVVSGAIRNE